MTKEQFLSKYGPIISRDARSKMDADLEKMILFERKALWLELVQQSVKIEDLEGAIKQWKELFTKALGKRKAA